MLNALRGLAVRAGLDAGDVRKMSMPEIMRAAAALPEASSGGGRFNLCLNPELNILPGTHTDAVRRNSTASNILNSEFLGWRSVSPGGSPNFTVAPSLSVFEGSKRSLLLSVQALGNDDLIAEMALIEGEAFAIDMMLYSARGLVLTFAANIKQAVSTPNAGRLAIVTDGTGGGTTYSAYHGENTNWERLIVSATIPIDATFIKLRMAAPTGITNYFLNKPMAVAGAEALTELDYEPRAPIEIVGYGYDAVSVTGIDRGSTGAGWKTLGIGGTGISPDWEPNDTRPAWANGCNSVFELKTGASGSRPSMGVRPLGSSSVKGESIIESAYSVSNHYMRAPVSFHFGQDSRVQVTQNDPFTWGVIYLNDYIGEGL